MCELIDIDVFIRVTGDMPFVSDEILQILLNSHFETAADFTTARRATLGTNLEIINTSSLIRLNNLMPKANFSEYMSWYFFNNINYFKINYVDLPSVLISNERLTLDYEEDLIMFNKLDEYFKFSKNKVNLQKIIQFLSKRKEVSNINNFIIPKYVSNKKLINKLKTVTKITRS